MIAGGRRRGPPGPSGRIAETPPRRSLARRAAPRAAQERQTHQPDQLHESEGARLLSLQRHAGNAANRLRILVAGFARVGRGIWFAGTSIVVALYAPVLCPPHFRLRTHALLAGFD